MLIFEFRKGKEIECSLYHYPCDSNHIECENSNCLNEWFNIKKSN